jgi:hypothetical protein
MSKKREKVVKPKKDAYQKRRGTPQFLNVVCAECQSLVVLYQKDGPGNLLRLYLDRIFAPAEIAQLQNTVFSKKDMPQLRCPQGHLIGLPMIYEPEQRLAFSLVPGSFGKRKHK